MTTPEPLIRYRKKPTPIRNALLAVSLTACAFETGILFYTLGQRSAAPAYVQEANWLEVVAQAERPHKKGSRR